MKIENIQLSKNNPRFIEMSNLDERLIEKIISGNEKYNEDKEIRKLLLEEGDFSNMLNLFESIKTSGFTTDGDQPILISHNNKFIVAEGNRRLTVLKLIANKIILDFSKFSGNNTDELDLIEALDDFEKKSMEYNIKKINELIEIIDFNDEWLNTENFVILENSEENDNRLWTLIYTKHIAGNRPGIRKWSRAKYFLDILNFFPNGIDKTNEELKKKVLVRIKRDFNTIFSDFKQAQFVRDFFMNEYKENWREEMKRRKVSALQYNFSLSLIKKMAAEQFFYKSDFKFDDYFKLNFDEKGIISYTGKVNQKNLFSFIYKLWSDGFIKTRDNISLEDKEDIKNSIELLFVYKMTDLDSITDQEIIDLDFSKLSDEKLERLEHTSKNAELKDFFKTTRETLQSNKALQDTIKSQSFLKSGDTVFDTLYNQLIHNSKKEYFYHAIAATIRAIYEQILSWGIYGDPMLIVKTLGGDGITPSTQDEYLLALSGFNFGTFPEKINKVFMRIREKLLNKMDLSKILNILTTLDGEKITELIKFFEENNETINDNINEFIHASHRVEILKNFTRNFENLKEWTNNLNLILANLKEDYISDLDEKIRSKIITVENQY